MQPPLANGTLLQNRFRLAAILGQGGCGRTYLATDEQRFDERCAIKEYFPSTSNHSSAWKLQQLFRREAELLYQIEHPQIPKFRAQFEEADRFFFAQDFVEGKSYQTLWQERVASGQTFSESEVVELLERMLPVLSYLHRQHIIHRDISLDNIMLRAGDLMPVPIDFGVATQEVISGEIEMPFGTMVGKAGYAPIEQLKTGRVYPNSDLYALAVCAIVLLTGRDPGNLFDEMTVSWVWRTHAPHRNSKLATILDRMLDYRPQNRYQSADEVSIALSEIANRERELVGAIAYQPRMRAVTGVYSNPPGIAAERAKVTDPPRSTGNPGTKIRRSPTAVEPPARRSSRPQPQWWQWGIGAAAMAIVGTLGFTLAQNSKPRPSVPPARANSAASPSSHPSAQALPLQGSTPLEVTGEVAANGVSRYHIDGSPDRQLQLQVKSGAVSVHILHPDGRTPPGNPALDTLGNYFFPYAGKYALEIAPKDSATATKFTLSIALVPTEPGFRPPMPPDRPGGNRPLPPDRNGSMPR